MAKKVILTIDDEEHILDLLEYNLEKNGYEVLRAETGEKGLAILKTMQVDLVLLDYMLPGMDGIGLLEKIRLMPAPVICCMLTGAAQVSVAAKPSSFRMGTDSSLMAPKG